MGEISHHPSPMSLAPDLLRQYAFTGNTEALRAYGREVLEKQPERAYAHDSLEIVAAIAENQYTVAAALIESTRYKYQKTELSDFINQATGLFEIFIDFALGRLNSVREKYAKVVALQPTKQAFQPIDSLALLKILADTAFLLDDSDEVARIYRMAEGYSLSGQSQEGLYFTNSIKVLHLFNQGDFRETLALADQTIALAVKNSFQGIAHFISLKNVKMRCFVAMAKHDFAHQLAPEILEEARALNMWPWYFVTDGFIVKHLAQQNRMPEALLKIRENREQIQSFIFKNELALFVDAAELYIRYLLRDEERIQVLMNRLPDLLLVRQIKIESEISKSERGIRAIESLPENNLREQLFKMISFCEFHKHQESLALKYARQALHLVEQTGYVQFLMLQHDLYSILLKACSIRPTAFTEEFARMLTEQIKNYDNQQKGALAKPLTAREREVIQHLATEKPISQIAASLHVSMNTMKTHLRNTYRKLDVDGRKSAVTKARELFLI